MSDGNGETAVDQGESVATKSAADDAAATPRVRRRKVGVRRLCLAVLELWLLLAVLAGGLYFAIERGAFDDVLKREALSILAGVVGTENYTADVASTTLRFNSRGQLELDARDVSLRPLEGGGEAFRTGHVKIALESLPLLTGRLTVASISVDGTGIDFAALPQSHSSEPLRVDAVPDALARVFSALDAFDSASSRTDIRKLKLTGIDFDVPAKQDRRAKIAISDITFARSSEGDLSISGDYTVDGASGTLKAVARRDERGIGALSLDLNNFDLRPFTMELSREGRSIIGLEGDLGVHVEAVRKTDKSPASLKMTARLANGAFFGEGHSSPITKAQISAHYDFAANKIEVEPSLFEFTETRIPFTGGFIDADRLDKPGAKGIAIDLLIDKGHAAPANLGDAPVDFIGKAFGTFYPDTLELVAPDMVISSQTGFVGGSLTVKFDPPKVDGMQSNSPEISLGLFTEKVAANTIRALWPFWTGTKGRDWVYSNLFGGTISNGSLALFLPGGMMPFYPEDPVVLNDSELKIRFDIENTRVSIAGDIPPLRDTVAHFEMVGDSINTAIKQATAYFPSGRTVAVRDGTFRIDRLSEPPTIATTSFQLQSDAAALLELTTYRPLSSLQNTGFKPDDVSGTASVSLKARFPLEALPNARPAEWTALLKLSDISIAKPLGGRKITAINGDMKINPLSAMLEADSKIDGVPFHISLVEPLSPASRQKRQRVVTADLDAAQLSKFVPGVEDVVTGRVKMRTVLKDDGSQAVEADLAKAKVVVPWAGWEKGAGVGAGVSFNVRQTGDKFQISSFDFSGDGFGAQGNMETDGGGLVSADFSKVQLAPSDDISVKIARSAGRYNITANGKAADARGLLARLKSPGSADGGGDLDFSVNAKIGTVTGFNGEVLKNVDAAYSVRKGKPTAVKLTAVTGNDQAVVAKLGQDTGLARSIDLTATDAGALARFSGIYANMRGGLMNVAMRYVSEGVWRGIVDVRNFQLVNEQRLQEIVSTRSGKDGKSLNEAVKRNIDVSSQKFSRGYGRILIDGETLRVENGVVRGEQVGATFQGVLRDGKGQMNMTGTFMPAYGLNRLFAELPIIGLFLGNGRDRGLIGITFRLSGPSDQPALQINPLSIIAPGIFRSIFQFQ